MFFKIISLIFFIEILILSEFAHGLRGFDAYSECGIIDNGELAVAFTFTEKPENTQVGTLLASYTTVNGINVILSDNNTNTDYIEVKFLQEKQQIEFYLKRPLPDHRDEIWTPNIEMNYNFSCENTVKGYSSNPLRKRYTFMLILENTNTYAPQFAKTHYDFDITLPWPTFIPLDVPAITAIDKDFSLDFATLKFTCYDEDDGDFCKNFDIRASNPVEQNGHNYTLSLFLTENSPLNQLVGINKGDNFTIRIAVNDSLYENYTTLTWVANLTRAIQTDRDPENTFSVTWISIGGTIACVLFVVLLGGFIRIKMKNRKQEDILRKLTEAEIREFMDGVAGFQGGAPKRSVDCNMPVLAMPYNRAFEISRDKLRIDETTVLGSGFFGIVMKGSVIQPNGESITVGVKAVKRNVGVLYFKALLSELKIMAFIGVHTNIVSLIGACTHNIRKREVYIAVEYCSNGNLNNYLRNYRSSFINLVKDGQFCGQTGPYSRRGSYSKTMSTHDLVKWSIQISKGLDYLADLGIIHGDLATRNILLDSNKVAKIADFGLSRRLVDINQYYYTKQSKAPLPWKWLSIEALKDMKFSKQSDIWSFGIVLWEIFTLGETPYPLSNYDESFLERLEKGMRPPRPEFATDQIYAIMSDCWTADPRDRPIIFDIRRILELMTNSLLISQNPTDYGYLKILGEDGYILTEKEHTDNDNDFIDC